MPPWVAFGVLAVFGLANADVSMVDLSFSDTPYSVTLGIVTRLFFGKQTGIMAMGWLAIRLRVGSSPDGAGWWQRYGAALLCGIGFTMSFFIPSLALEQGGAGYLGLERLGILIGSLVSGLLGHVALRTTSADRAKAA